MGQKFKHGLMYRMPTYFGPATGPRQGPEKRNQYLGLRYGGESTAVSVSFLTNAEQLENFVPEDAGLELGKEPFVTVTATYDTGLLWLAGRGYNTLGVTFPVVFKGKQDQVAGSLMSVLWENMTDPILTGREELGFSKIYADLPPARIYNTKVHCIALWEGFKFADLTIENLEPMGEEELASLGGVYGGGEGFIHYKYMPRTGAWGTPDIAQVTMTPFPNAGDPPDRLEAWKGKGAIKFHEAAWEDLPTQYMIVNALNELEIKEYRSAVMIKSVGGTVSDLSDTRILE